MEEAVFWAVIFSVDVTLHPFIVARYIADIGLLSTN
jgi:hypothetical protein